MAVFSTSPESSRGRRWWTITLVMLAVTAWTVAASATVMVYADLARLVEISDVVVQGQVVGQRTYHAEGDGTLVTDTTVRVERRFMGEVGQTVTFQQWGGELKEKAAWVPGDARFEPDEEVIVFLRRGPDHQPGLYLSAMGLSKYRVLGSGPDAVVVRHMDDLAVVGADGQITHRDDEKSGYASFTAELETLVAGIKGGAR